MSFEQHHGADAQKHEPSPAVQEEAAKIIAKLDGNDHSQYFIDDKNHDTQRAFQARQMLIDDAQKFSPQDMKDLMLTIMKGEDRTKGYDMNYFGHSTREIREFTEKQIEERQVFASMFQKCTPEERVQQMNAYNKEKAKELEAYTKEIVVTFTHNSRPADPSKGDEGRKPGDWIRANTFHMVNGLPKFEITDGK